MKRLCTIAFFACGTWILPRSVPAQLRGPELDLAIHQYLQPLVALRTFSGVILLARGDSLLIERAYGLADAEHSVPMTTESAFRVASISKSFTRALIGRLIDQQALAIDDTLSRWLPTFPSANRITLRLLLDHRAGVPDINWLPYSEEASAPQTLAALIDSLARTPLDFPPGSARRYSNGGYAVLASVIERVTGEPYDIVLTREILHPVGLGNTRHQHDGELVPNLARGLMPSPVVSDGMVAAPYQAMATKTGSGSLVSTGRDLLKWSRAIGTHSILTKDRWRQMFANDSSFAFDGRSPGYMALLLRESDLTAVVLANNYDAMVSEIGGALVTLARGGTPKSLPVVAPASPEDSTDQLVGTYRDPEGTSQSPRTFEVKRQHGHLVAYRGHVPVDVLIPQGQRTYLLRNLWTIATFATPASDGAPFVELKPLYDRPTFRAERIPSHAQLDSLPADILVPIYVAALRYYSPPPRQVRWVEKPIALTDTSYDELLERLGAKFRSLPGGESERAAGGILRVTNTQTLAEGRWRVAVQFRYRRQAFVGPASTQTFDIDRRGDSYVIISRHGGDTP